MTPPQLWFITADAVAGLRQIPDGAARCCVTSPPYWGLRDYGVEGQIGLERTPEEYVERLVGVFKEVRRVLTDDGTLWLNLGDSYANDTKWGGASGGKHAAGLHGNTGIGRQKVHTGLKAKDLVGIPWRVAFALQADGWYLRCDIIWSKPNPMPESVTDRPTKSHEYLFLLSKQERYFYDQSAIMERAVYGDHPRTTKGMIKAANTPGQSPHNGLRPVFKQDHVGKRTYDGFNARWFDGTEAPPNRNRRSVWSITTEPYAGSHYAVMPSQLAKLCVLAGSQSGDTVLDPFYGSGTTALVAHQLNRHFIGIDLDPKNRDLARERMDGESMPIPFEQGG